MNQFPIALLASLCVSGAVFAQQKIGDATTATPSQATIQASNTVEGEVRKVDKSLGRITLRHGEIKHLDMPSMTMNFHVGDKSLLENIKQGDKVKFQVKHEQGQFIITDIKPRP